MPVLILFHPGPQGMEFPPDGWLVMGKVVLGVLLPRPGLRYFQVPTYFILETWEPDMFSQHYLIRQVEYF